MKYLLAYTVKGKVLYSELNDSLHLALSDDGVNYSPLRNNTGVFFLKAAYDEGDFKGVTKLMTYPWIFSCGDGYGLVCVRNTRKGADLNPKTNPQRKRGYVNIYFTKDFIGFSEPTYLGLSDFSVRSPRVEYREKRSAYYIEWDGDDGKCSAYTTDFVTLTNKREIAKFSIPIAKAAGVENCVPSNAIQIPDELAQRLITRYGRIYNVGVNIPCVKARLGEKPVLPKAEFLYNDGSTHLKRVKWEEKDFSAKGEYEVKGTVEREIYPFPFIEKHISDPCVTEYNGKYYLTHTGSDKVILRVSDSVMGLKEAPEIVLYSLKDENLSNLWAQELHIIKGVPYIFTTVGKKEWYTVRAHVLRCSGDIENPADWSEPILVLKKDGTELNPNGISLDMTYFEDGGRSYVMWSNRINRGWRRNALSPDFEPADVYIATVAPDTPWILTSDPVRVVRPMYGWDRLQTEVDEGPFALKHGDDLFVTVSGSSTEVDILYCLGLLKAKSGADLLNAESWEWLNYPVLTKESVKGEYGPGHNSFIKNKDGDDFIVYHAVPLDEDGKSLTRHMAIRRVHWKADGLPYFEMTPDEDVRPEFSTVACKVIIE